MKLLLATLDSVGDGQARRNMLTALGDVRPTHLLDRTLREACGLDPASGEVVHERGLDVAHMQSEAISDHQRLDAPPMPDPKALAHKAAK